MSRRPPPPFLRAVLGGRERLSARITRVRLEGHELEALHVTQPASSVRLLLPAAGSPERIDIPGWDGNRFVGPDGGRPPLRTMTPRPAGHGTAGHGTAGHGTSDHATAGQAPSHGRGALHLDVVTHGPGLASTWATAAELGSPVALSGPARGYDISPEAGGLVVGGDETAYAAVCSIIEAAPQDVRVIVALEVAGGAPPPLPAHPGLVAEVLVEDGRHPGSALADWLAGVDLPPTTHLWAGGEAAAMQRLRVALFQERSVPRARATIRGYWKHGRPSEDAPD